MKRKIMIGGILVILMLITISYSTAINTTKTETKESPLWRLRNRRAIGDIIENVKTKFLGERIFWVPILLSSKSVDRLSIRPLLTTNSAVKTCFTCWGTCALEKTECGITCRDLCVK